MPEGYTPYYRRLEFLSPKWADAAELRLTLSAIGGVSRLVLRIPRGLADTAALDGWICRLEGSWDPEAPFLVDSSCRTALDCVNFSCPKDDSGARIVVTPGVYGPVVSVKKEARPVAQDLRLECDVLNLQVQLPERAPFHRALVGLALTWGKDKPPLRVVVDRPNDTLTCFTKGNYDLAFPARPSSGARQETHILYRPSAETCFLRYGYAVEPLPHVAAAASTLVLAGTAYCVVAALYRLIPAGQATDLTKTFAALAAMSLPLYRTLLDASGFDRHTYYSRKTHFNFWTTIAIGSVLLLLIALAVGGLAPPVGVDRVATRWGQIDVAATYLAVGSLHLVGSLVLVGVYRSGLLVKYVCDNHFCSSRLRLRYRSRDCYATGRVVCNNCYVARCASCRCDFRRFTVTHLVPLDASDGYLCRPIDPEVNTSP